MVFLKRSDSSVLHIILNSMNAISSSYSTSAIILKDSNDDNKTKESSVNKNVLKDDGSDGTVEQNVSVNRKDGAGDTSNPVPIESGNKTSTEGDSTFTNSPDVNQTQDDLSKLESLIRSKSDGSSGSEVDSRKPIIPDVDSGKMTGKDGTNKGTLLDLVPISGMSEAGVGNDTPNVSAISHDSRLLDDLFNNNFTNFSLLTDQDEILSDASIIFKEYVTRRSKNVVPDPSLKHIKNAKNAEQLAANKDIFIKWSVCKDFYCMYSHAILNSVEDLSPISDSYIRELDVALASNDRIAGYPVYKLNTDGKSVAASSLYGVAHGLHELYHFSESDWSNIHFEFDYRSKLESDKKVASELKLQFQNNTNPSLNRDYNFNVPLLAFQPEGDSDIRRSFKEESMFDSSKKGVLLDQMYSIVGSCAIDFSNQGVSERVSFNLRTSEGHVTYAQGYKSTINNVDGFRFPGKDSAIMDQILSMFLIDFSKVKVNEVENIATYASTCIVHYLDKSVIQISGAKVINMSIKFRIARNIDNAQLRNSYVNYISNGYIIPMTPLQYKFYFSNIDFKIWYYYMLYGSCVNTRVNPAFISVMPRMKVIDKTFFSMVSRSRDRRITSYYDSEHSLPFQKEMVAHLSRNDFIREMFVKTLIQEGYPDYIYNISSARWEGNSGKSNNIGVASLSSLFCKFGLSDFNKHIENFVEQLSLDQHDSGFIPPYYAKSRTRLCENIPSLYNNFLPVAEFGIIQDELSEEPDTYCSMPKKVHDTQSELSNIDSFDVISLPTGDEE